MKKIIRCDFILALGLLISVTLTGCATSGYKKLPSASLHIAQERYLPLSVFCADNGFSWEWDGFSKIISIRKFDRKIRLYIGSSLIADNDQIQDLGSPVRIYNGLIVVPTALSRLFIKEQSRSLPEEKMAKGFSIKKIVLDAGHGGKDPGAVSLRGIKEKNIVLDIAKRIKKELMNKNIEVILTREEDAFFALNERSDKANRAAADFFVSIHANASRSQEAKGFEVFYLSNNYDDFAKAVQIRENAAVEFEEGTNYQYSSGLNATLWDMILNENRIESLEIADSISDELRRILNLKTRYVKGAMFYVLKGAQMPAVLLEVGYLSNSTEEARLCNPYYRQMLAEAIASGIINYKRQFELTNGFTR